MGRRRGQGEIEIEIPTVKKTVRSNCIFFDTNSSITKKVIKATLLVTFTGAITFYFGLSSTITGSVSWIKVSPNAETIFVNPQEALFWRADGELNAQITAIKAIYEVNVA